MTNRAAHEAMSETSSSPLYLATLGMDGRSQAALEMALRGPGRGVAVVVDESSANATLIDLDGLGARTLFDQHQTRFPDRAVIALSVVAQEKLNGARYLKKPVRINELLQTLQRIKEEMSEHLQTAAGDMQAGAPAAPSPDPLGRPQRTHRPTKGSVRDATRSLEHQAYLKHGADGHDIDINDPEQLQKLFFDPDAYVGGYFVKAVQKAMDEQKPSKVIFRDERIIIDPANSRIFTTLHEKNLRQFAFLRDSGPDYCESASLSNKVIEKLDKKHSSLIQLMSVESFLWQTSVWLSRGRVPQGASLSKPVTLLHWPNMTRLLVTPHALRIAALWMQGPRSLVNTATVLDIPIPPVLTFYTAADSIGLVTAAKRRSDSLLEPEPVQKHRHRGLMQRILARLRGEK